MKCKDINVIINKNIEIYLVDVFIKCWINHLTWSNRLLLHSFNWPIRLLCINQWYTSLGGDKYLLINIHLKVLKYKLKHLITLTIKIYWQVSYQWYNLHIVYVQLLHLINIISEQRSFVCLHFSGVKTFPAMLNNCSTV